MKYPIDSCDNDIINKGFNAIVDYFRMMAISESQYLETIRFATGINYPFLMLNGVFDTRTIKKNSKKLVESAKKFFDPYQVSWAWFVSEDDNDLEACGLALIEEAPAMYFTLSQPLPVTNSSFITIKELAPANNLREWIEPINESFKVETDNDSYRNLNATLSQKEAQKLRHFVAYYRGELAGSGTLFISNNSSMLHNIATKNQFKHRGVATTLTLHMMEIAKKLGLAYCFLDATEDAFSLYKKIGFSVYETTLVYCQK